MVAGKVAVRTSETPPCLAMTDGQTDSAVAPSRRKNQAGQRPLTGILNRLETTFKSLLNKVRAR